MSLRVEYTYDEKNKIITRCFCGEVRLQDNIDSWDELFSEYDFTSIRGVINDFSEAEMRMEIDEISTLLKYLSEHLSNLPNIKLPVIALKPEIIVFPSIAANDFPNLNIKPFSTIEGALSWILN